MKIAKSPYLAKIAPHRGNEEALWFCVIRREGSSDIVVRRDATTKEDAYCAAWLELTRLHAGGSGQPHPEHQYF